MTDFYRQLAAAVLLCVLVVAPLTEAGLVDYQRAYRWAAHVLLPAIQGALR